MTGPSGNARAAAIVPPDVKAARSETNDCGEGGGPAPVVARALLDAPVGGLLGAAQGKSDAGARARRAGVPVYAALDLGTNNCRLLVARPSRRGFLVIDAFSRIIRLGEGVLRSGYLSDAAMNRTIDALKICSDKMRRRNVSRSRLIATEACRIASNSGEFIDRVRCDTGLAIEIVSRETEAKLAVSGCASLIDRNCDWALVFDIGGGSSELIWLDLTRLDGPWRRSIYDRLEVQSCIAGWTSLPIGVVNLAERHGGREVGRENYEAMVADVMAALTDFEEAHRFRERIAKCCAHFLGTSGTVTTIAGIHLGLPAYDRSRVDGCWLSAPDARRVSDALIDMSYAQRVAQPCIGQERADLVLAGCAILEALLRVWPCQRLRVADRGLREGILATLMAEDGHGGAPHHRHRPWPHVSAGGS
ncbi:Ppx/GppA phosphatase family protein [Methyloceanibacter sp.]|uniref:Ppx/GppA phosphatase family protein n=1 Tax=Methyloceanibacter sp. TaxID=1965321 RepID=UPI003D6D7E73